MKARFNRIVSLILALLTVCLLAVGCAETGVTTDAETTAADETVKETEAETTEDVTTGVETTEPQTTEAETTAAPETETETETETQTETETETETEAPHTHTFGDWTVTKQPTCTETGTEERRCAECNEIEIRTVEATGHTPVTDKAVAATCTADGKTEGSHCGVCGAVITAQTVVKATGHKFGDWKVTKPATDKEEGTETRKCSVCGKEETRKIAITAPKTSTPKVLGTKMTAGDRVLVYGECEPNSVIRTVINGNEMKNKSKDKYFYIEMGIGGKSEITVYATASGKAESAATKVTVTPDGSQTGNVWGGKDSRIFYMPTLHFLISARGDTGYANNFAQGLLANQTMPKIQEATGKETKLIFCIIPDPATGYYQEQFDYIQNSVLNPSSSIMGVFNKAVNGKHKDMYAVDLLPTLRAHKDESIYFSTDTHYTELGAYYAYLDIMKIVKQNHPNTKVRTVENGDYNIVYKDVPGGDLCGIAGLGMNEVVPFFEANFSDTGSYYISKRNDGIKSAGFGPGGWQRDSVLNDSNNPTAYFIADSYGCYILPFIGANFSKVWTNEGVLWNYGIDRNILTQNKPDYIIFVMCQRNIDGNYGNIAGFAGSI